ncbi:hypothetical protein CEK00_09640 [Stenotrophomonas maltophilia]|uniref:Uncharacterized protein n=1 Tax=Stenotrophomonas maltophilia TaxID=40324 RepID=A0A270NIE8_STEMA|nr:hypothetical protein [Stenotrophomonas maltophilia]PAM64686.1 hypothetical protein CEK00_21960 [Stenotrophomonas maltophilia]PAM71843.1 hypothetical protein CEK00_09640 [Stenotrophomonas maltophilia]
MSTITQTSPLPPAIPTDIHREEEATLACLTEASNHAAPVPLPALEVHGETAPLPEAHAAAPNVFQAVVAPEFIPGCREQGRVGLRMKISSRG